MKPDKPDRSKPSTQAKDSADDPDLPDDIASLPKDARDAMIKADKQIDDMYAKMPAASFAMLPPVLKAALAKYGKWSRVPLSVRQKIAKAMADGSSGSTADIAATIHEDRPKVPGLGPDGWVVYRRFRPPAGFDPKHVDAAKYLPFALAEAKKLVPDAVLFRIDASGVFPDGHADLTAVDNGMLDYRFISPSRARRDPSKPIGAKQEWKCMFRVMIDKDGPWSAPLDGWECKEKLIGPPKCSFVQVWKKALAKKAPANALGSLGYRPDSSGNARWYFSIRDDSLDFSELFSDDC